MIFAMILSLPDNQMQYDLQGFLNNVQATVASWMMVLGAILIFFPIRNRKKVARIEYRAYQEFKALPQHLNINRFHMWEDKQQERICFIDRMASLKKSVVAQESIQLLLMMMRMGRCFRRQHTELTGISLSPALKAQVSKAEWFWPRQKESSDRFLIVAQRLVDALVQEASAQPTFQLKLLAAAQEWRMIISHHKSLVTQSC